MSICGSSSKAGFGRRPVSGAWSPASVLTVSACFQIQRKVVVCGDGACGMHLYTPLFFLPAQHRLIHRQNITTQRFHKRLLYPSIVSPGMTKRHPRIPSFISYSEPTVFENYVHDIYVDDQLVELSLWDTAGKCLHWPLRVLRS